MNKPEILEVADTSLDEWIELLRQPLQGKVFVRNMFPTQRHKADWLRTSVNRSDAEVKLLLRNFLISTGSSPLDTIHAQYLAENIQRRGVSGSGLREYDRRLVAYLQTGGKFPVWEGLGWVIDLLPHHPRKALDVIDAFFHANWQLITDNYVSSALPCLITWAFK